jgi:hypothetical protein
VGAAIVVVLGSVADGALGRGGESAVALGGSFGVSGVHPSDAAVTSAATTAWVRERPVCGPRNERTAKAPAGAIAVRGAPGGAVALTGRA